MNNYWILHHDNVPSYKSILMGNVCLRYSGCDWSQIICGYKQLTKPAKNYLYYSVQQLHNTKKTTKQKVFEQHKFYKPNDEIELKLTLTGEENSSKYDEALLNRLSSQVNSRKKKKITVPSVLTGTPVQRNSPSDNVRSRTKTSGKDNRLDVDASRQKTKRARTDVNTSGSGPAKKSFIKDDIGAHDFK